MPINSDPTNADGDEDGKHDKTDKTPLNMYVIFSQLNYTEDSITLSAGNKIKFEYEQKMIIDFSWFYESPNVYNNDLALASSIMSGLAYHTTEMPEGAVSDRISKKAEEYCYAIKDAKGDAPRILPEILEEYDFKDCQTYNLRECRKDEKSAYYNDNHYIQFDIGYKDISEYKDKSSNETKTNLVGIFVRGTHGTEEWYSNFDIGNTDEWQEGTDWWTKANHTGFDIAAVRAKKEIDEYLSNNKLDKNDTVIWLTGHSRGAAVSGIIATYLIKDGYIVYGYNFATPRQVETEYIDDKDKSNENYRTIFNIINKDDLVPYLPLSSWGFENYGKLSFGKMLEFDEEDTSQWQNKGVSGDYSTSPEDLEDVISVFQKMSKKRNLCYDFVYNDDTKNINEDTKCTVKKAFYNQLPELMKNSLKEVSGKKNKYYQKPIYFMQLLAGVAAQDIKYNSLKFVIGSYTADYYNESAWAFAKFTISTDYMEPHFIDGYIILCE